MTSTFYTCANKKYEDFAPIFAHSSLYHNDDIVVEIGFDNDDIINSEAIKYVKNIYCNKLVVHKVAFDEITLNNKTYRICPNIVRMITTPMIKNEYVYIADIDMLNLEKNINKINIDNMNKLGLNYNNIVRPNSEKLTGLHFVKWDSYYPFDNLEELSDLFSFDENFLYAWMKKKGNILSTSLATFVPQHGIHISPNQTLMPSKKWCKNWLEYRNSKDFLGLEPLLSNRIMNIIKEIDKLLK